jgi:hypothetical protein
MIPALFSVMLLVTDAAAATPAPAAPATKAAEAPKAERQICKREPIAQSQYRTKRVCMTAAQWKARARGEGIEDLSDVSTKATQ